MTLDEDIKQIKSGIEDVKQRPLSGSRCGLYIMVAIATLGSINSCEQTQKILNNYQKVPQLQVENVISSEAPEKFYELNGQRVYLEIDGKSVEQYFQGK